MSRESLFDGFDPVAFSRMARRCYNVHQLREILKLLPGGMLINGHDGVFPRVVNVGWDNVGHNCEHLCLEDE